MNMDPQARFAAPPPWQTSQQRWPSLVVKRQQIDAEIERLADSALPSAGVRAAAINHPMNVGRIPTFSPSTDVTIEVLKPGEESPPRARNATALDICLRGSGIARVGRKELRIERHDVWNTPAMVPHTWRNTGDDLLVRLTYSNLPLLDFMGVVYVDPHPQMPDLNTEETDGIDLGARRARDAAAPIPIGADGADLRGYEWLVDIDRVDAKVLHWPWKEVSPHLGGLYAMDLRYSGRHLYLMYNPATGRLMGTTPVHFATIAKNPPGKIDRPHRHTSASINYYLWGHGKSTVEGERVEWEGGDLQFSAPGWATHNHGSREQGFVALTVQDHPLHLSMDSLMWQEELKGPVRHLGSAKGFQTNLQTVTT
ncbi:MAG TPA: hypothetical protein VLK85_30935 [Ramlibacter sp.]|nr:hypothetical protein [Ramlibacter sp.]